MPLSNSRPQANSAFPVRTSLQPRQEQLYKARITGLWRKRSKATAQPETDLAEQFNSLSLRTSRRRIQNLQEEHRNSLVNQQQQANMANQPSDDAKSRCRTNILSIFPDIDLNHLTYLCEQGHWLQDGVVEQILNQQEDGHPYPKATRPNLKRKREEEEDDDSMALENQAKQFDNEQRRQKLKPHTYLTTSYLLLQQSFPQLYMDDVRKTLDRHYKCLYPTYLALNKVMVEWDPRNPPFRTKTRVSKPPRAYNLNAIDEAIRNALDGGEREALEEFRAARAIQQKQRAQAEEEKRKEQKERENFEISKIEGNIADCGCCFVEYAMNRMVHCDGEMLHWFCRDCARMMAETQIGLSKYRLDCMSTDGCSGGFAMDQREIFLDTNLKTALDRIEQEAVLREAGIEDLETCPFCPFAMEYPPLDVDREFRCLKPDCKVVSCRACRKETHVPKTCEEAAIESGHSARHTIEEAMSAALIRKCNKCSTPFIKENGCNKMSCTKCGNIQCYICSNSCDYAHFNDPKRGGKQGNCPLFDENGIEVRHSEEVKNAESAARKKILEENVDINAALLEFNTSKKVQEDEERRKKQEMPARHVHHAIGNYRGAFQDVIEQHRLLRRHAQGRQGLGAIEVEVAQRPVYPDQQQRVVQGVIAPPMERHRNGPPPGPAPAPVPAPAPPLVAPQRPRLPVPVPVWQPARKIINHPVIRPPVRPGEPVLRGPQQGPGLLAGILPVNPLGDGLNGAMARIGIAPEIRQSTNLPVDQDQFGVANQTPHRAGNITPAVGQINHNVFNQDPFGAQAMGLPFGFQWWQLPPPPPVPLFPPADQQIPEFQPQPQLEVQNQNPDGNLILSPPARPMVDFAIQQGNQNDGLIADHLGNLKDAGAQDIWQWDALNIFPDDWDFGAPLV